MKATWPTKIPSSVLQVFWQLVVLPLLPRQVPPHSITSLEDLVSSELGAIVPFLSICRYTSKDRAVQVFHKSSTVCLPMSILQSLFEFISGHCEEPVSCITWQVKFGFRALLITYLSEPELHSILTKLQFFFSTTFWF